MFLPDKNHIHHRLLRNGCNVKEAVHILYFLTAVFGVLGIIIVDGNIKKIITYLIIVAICSILGMKEVIKKVKQKTIECNIENK